MEQSVHGKTALVTAAGHGIGRASAEVLAKAAIIDVTKSVPGHDAWSI